MSSWMHGSYTIPDADAPWYDSQMPEEQEDVSSEVTPIGATGTDATIITHVSTPSIGAEGSAPFTLHYHCGTATHDDLIARKRTTFTLKTPFDTTGKSVYLKRLEVHRWTSSESFAVAGSDQRYHMIAHYLGR